MKRPSSFFSPLTIADDRGTRVPLLNPHGTPWPVKTDERVRLLARRVNARVQDGAEKSVCKPKLLVGVFMALVMLFGLWIVHAGGFPDYLFLVLLGFAIFGFFLLIHRAYLGASGGPVAALILEEGLCPSCGYNFHGITPTPQIPLQYVCPECGSAWNADRVKRLMPFVGDGQAQVGSALQSLATATRDSGRFDTWIGKAQDARGAPVPVVHPRLRRELRASQSQEHRARLLAARHQIARAARGNAWGMYLLMGLMVAGNSLVLYSSLLGGVGAGLPLATILLVCSLATGVSLLAGRTAGVKADNVRRAMLNEGLCPSCGRPLGDLPPGKDGCVECPTCRSAWCVDVSSERHTSSEISSLPRVDGVTRRRPRG